MDVMLEIRDDIKRLDHIKREVENLNTQINSDTMRQDDDSKKHPHPQYILRAR